MVEEELKGDMLLEINNCSLSFGGVNALIDFRARLHAGELLGIIGPNGAGKTTLFNILMGVYKPDRGSVLLEGSPIEGLPSFQINRRGIARTFQNIRLFQNLTVEENVLVAYHHLIRSTLWSASFNLRSCGKETRLLRKKAFDLLEIFGLLDKRLEPAMNLPYGDQRRLEIVRALATAPRLLLLDEPAAGMNLTEKNQLIQLIRQIQKDYHLAVILIEHDMSVVMSLCPRIVVLDYGEIIAEGTPEEIRKNPNVIEAYLGEKVRI